MAATGLENSPILEGNKPMFFGSKLSFGFKLENSPILEGNKLCELAGFSEGDALENSPIKAT